MIAIRRIELPVPGMDGLRAEARAQGYDFLEALFEEWQSGENRFAAPGEALCGYFDEGLLTAVGGLNIDPFAGQPDIGRIRRVYVRSAWRNRGIGRSRVAMLVAEAQKSFRCVRLRAENANAARLYERIGFSPIDSPAATHILHFVE
jgi:GNAT superfamily N-acetyltransferase